MTDPIITAAKDDRDRRDAIKARLFDGLDPAAALAAALDLLLVREEDVDGLRADVRRLTDERDQARCAARDNAHQHERLLDASGDVDRLAALLAAAEEEAETQRRAACNLRDALDRVATAAGVADGSGDEVADRIVAVIDKLRESVARLTKPEAQPVATVEPAPTKSDRYVVLTRDKIPAGTPAVWLGLYDPSERVAAMVAASPGRFTWTVEAPTWATAAIIDTTASTPPVKPAHCYAPSPIDHRIDPCFSGDRYVAVQADRAMDAIPPDRILWRGSEYHAVRDAECLNLGSRLRDHYTWGPDSTPEVRRWAVVDRGEPIGEEG